MGKLFNLHAEFTPQGDQPAAIRTLVAGLNNNCPHQVLLGVTGSGKTFTMAKVIEAANKPTLVMAPNKTLAAQLFGEFKRLFPDNAVEYFVSYYDYYQPEAYIPQSDTYIEKDSSINDFIDRLRHSATRSVLTRRDVIVVASVSCIYGLGSPKEYEQMHLYLRKGDERPREEIIYRLVSMLYERKDIDFHRGVFRVRGDVIDIFPAHEEDKAIRVELFGDEIEALSVIDPLRGIKIAEIKDTVIYPTSHYVTTQDRLKRAIKTIKAELKERLDYFYSQGKLLEAQRLEQRTLLDLDMLSQLGYCHGIENYARHLSGRTPGEPPPCLLDYFPKDFLLIIDESHITVPQIRGMYAGDRSRKETLVTFGFRLPSALDNRPLKFEEFKSVINQVIYVSATPGPYEIEQAKGNIVEQVIRPTGLMDPVMEIRPASTQIDDLVNEIHKRIDKGQRILVTTMTKRLAEDLTDYLISLNIRVAYLHSDIKTIERSKTIQALRKGIFDVLIGINLLREGLDMPEVSLVAILDADKEGFLRSERSLIQTAGRAARNAEGKVILYADKITKSIRKAVSETNRRRKIQEAYNKQHGIKPKTILKHTDDTLYQIYKMDYVENKEDTSQLVFDNIKDLSGEIKKLEKQMFEAAKTLDFEKAATLRDTIKKLKEQLI